MTRLFLFTAVLFCSGPLFAESEAERLNKSGYAAYVKKDYTTAIKFFQAAVQADDSFVYAHHNYACVLAIARGRAALPEIIASLKAERRLDQSRMEKILSDNDLDPVRKNESFIDFILDGNGGCRIGWTAAPGSSAAGYEIRFLADGTAEYYEVWESGMGGDETSRQPSIKGRYAMWGSRVLLYFPGLNQAAQDSPFTVQPTSDGRDFIYGTLSDGRLEFEDFRFMDQWTCR